MKRIITNRYFIPANGFYEWDGAKNQYYFTLPDSGFLYLGGLYRQFNNDKHFTILTAPANDSISKIHNRMPVVINAEAP